MKETILRSEREVMGEEEGDSAILQHSPMVEDSAPLSQSKSMQCVRRV